MVLKVFRYNSLVINFLLKNVVLFPSILFDKPNVYSSLSEVEFVYMFVFKLFYEVTAQLNIVLTTCWLCCCISWNTEEQNKQK